MLLLFSMISAESVPDLTAEMFLGTLLLTGIKFLIQLGIPALQYCVCKRQVTQMLKAAKRHQVHILGPDNGAVHNNTMKIFYQLLKFKKRSAQNQAQHCAQYIIRLSTTKAEGQKLSAQLHGITSAEPASPSTGQCWGYVGFPGSNGEQTQGNVAL